MPELPEIETIKRIIDPQITGRRIDETVIMRPTSFAKERQAGCLLATLPDFPKEKHTHVIFRLSGGLELRFSDTRRFGRFWLPDWENEGKPSRSVSWNKA